MSARQNESVGLLARQATPAQSQGRKAKFKLTLTNTGTVPLSLWMEGSDQEGMCTFEFPPPPNLEPGEEGVVPVWVGARRSSLIGAPETFDIRLKVSPAGAESTAAKAFDARFVHKPLTSARFAFLSLLVGLLVAVVGVVAAGGFVDGIRELVGGDGSTPAPAILGHTPAATPGSNGGAIRRQIDDATGPLRQAGGVAYVEQDGLKFSYESSRQIPSASSVKALIALEVERQVEAGLLSWSQMVTVASDDIVGGTGILQNQAGRQLTLDELVRTMLDYSDNTAGNIVIGLLGGFDSVNELAHSLGLTQTRMERHFMDFDAQAQGFENRTSVEDLGKLFSLLSEGRAVSSTASAGVLAKLAHREQTYSSWTGRRLPAGAIIASINGVLPGERIGVSLLDLGEGRRGVLAVALVEQADEAGAEEMISSTGLGVFNALRK